MDAVNSTLTCLGQPSNPDISGIGIRFSFYLQTFILVILVNRSWEDAPGCLWTFLCTSFGLTVASLSQARGNNLSLFEAIEVSNLVWLANFGTFLALACYSRQKNQKNKNKECDCYLCLSAKKEEDDRDHIVTVGVVLQTILSIVLTIYMWAKADTFGNTPQCNSSIKYIAFYRAEFPALTSGRILALTCTALILAGYACVTAYECYCVMIRWKEREKAEKERKEKIYTSDSYRPGLSFDARRSTHNRDGITVLHHKSHPGKTHRSGTQERKYDPRIQRLPADPLFVGILIFSIIIITHFIASNEIYLRRNVRKDEEDNSWGFGQIFAIIVVVPSLVSVARAFGRNSYRRVTPDEDV